MEREKSWEIITRIGISLQESWQSLADKYELELSLTGLPSLGGFAIRSKYALQYKTLIAQEMLKGGYLASTSCYTSIAHTSEIIEQYLGCLESIFCTIASCESGELSISDLLEGPICHNGFKRLN